MRIDEGRRDEIVAGIELEPAGGGQVGRDGGDFAALHADIEAGPAIRQACVADNQVERAHDPILARTEGRVSLAFFAQQPGSPRLAGASP